MTKLLIEVLQGYEHSPMQVEIEIDLRSLAKKEMRDCYCRKHSPKNRQKFWNYFSIIHINLSFLVKHDFKNVPKPAPESTALSKKQ